MNETGTETYAVILYEVDRLPQLFAVTTDYERAHIEQASRLIELGFYGHCLLDLWAAAISNLRRKIEAYGIDLFEAIESELPGARKKVKRDGDTLNERWAGVDDLNVIAGAQRLGIISKKAAQQLKNVNWLRSHASPAHPTDEMVERADVELAAVIVQRYVFSEGLPSPGFSVRDLIRPLKESDLANRFDIVREQLDGLNSSDRSAIVGVLTDLVCKGESPGKANAEAFFPVVWEQAIEDVRKRVGTRYHTLWMDVSSDDSSDGNAASRLLDVLVRVNGVKYIPDPTRAILFRRAATRLAKAKDKYYGWKDEEAEARTLMQLGINIPESTFSEVYREILAVWFGNRWGHSEAHKILAPFIDVLSPKTIRKVVRLVMEDDRVREELHQEKPRKRALKFLETIRDRVVLESDKKLADDALQSL
jgi:hypothetical protein